jgi:cytochrome c-type biogenesis protein
MTTRIVPILVLAAFFAWGSPTFAIQALETGQTVPDFTLTALDGTIVRVSKSHGDKGTVIVFWAAWSPRSAEALSALQDLYQRHGTTGHLQVIAVNVEHETWGSGEYDEVVRYIQAKNLSFPIVFDMDLTLYERYGVTVVPYLVLTDANGKVVTKLAGYPESMRKYFYRDLHSALGSVP